jgi:thiosulfate/3-mercaptopyruvate sulfurtransferase
VIALLTLSIALAGQAPRDSMLVNTAWLADRLSDPKLVLFQVGERPEYERAHIPGAQFIEMRDVAAPRGPGLILELPAAARLDSALEARGVSDDSRIVLYWGSDWMSPTARVYLTLAWAGLGARVSILDGGLPAWRAEGRPVTTDVPTPKPGSLTIRPLSDIVVNATWVAQQLNDPHVAIVDARNPQFYDGRDTSHARPGHIPGARNLPFDEIVDSSGYFKSPAQLTELYRGAGGAPGKLLVAYCHIGQQASLVWFGARLLGYDARLYDGSFTEWTTLQQYPVERTP